ncbi:MAG TPA: imidazolonepropionase [Steroidobacteraceae bacterium]|nr:imidazolonepropionase [Steroidobacteraceae bacterium]
MTTFEPGAIVTAGEKIDWIGRENELPAELWPDDVAQFDLEGRWVTPGLIDCHTHLVFAGTRAHEWAQLLNGVSYEELARRGGGILSTVKATRQAGEAELFNQSASRLEDLVKEGVTTVEIKSGYGLTLEDERKMLRVARELGVRYPVTIRTTFLAAHAVPPEFAGRADAYMDEVIRHWMPALHAEGLIDAVDVFCERIAFDIAQSERLFAAAQKLRLSVRMHAEQLSNIGASQLATRFGALSCDHLEYSTHEDVRAMAAAGTVAVLLPTAYLHLNETKLPPLNALRSNEAAVAVASDCNPGSSPSPSLLLAGALATRLFKMTPTEVLAGVTRHAAKACGVDGDRGVLRTGATADFAIWDVSSVDELTYWIGRNCIRATVRDGELIRGWVKRM